MPLNFKSVDLDSYHTVRQRQIWNEERCNVNKSATIDPKYLL